MTKEEKNNIKENYREKTDAMYKATATRDNNLNDYRSEYLGYEKEFDKWAGKISQVNLSNKRDIIKNTVKLNEIFENIVLLRNGFFEMQFRFEKLSHRQMIASNDLLKLIHDTFKAEISQFDKDNDKIIFKEAVDYDEYQKNMKQYTASWEIYQAEKEKYRKEYQKYLEKSEIKRKDIRSRKGNGIPDDYFYALMEYQDIILEIFNKAKAVDSAIKMYQYSYVLIRKAQDRLFAEINALKEKALKNKNSAD